MLFALAQTDVTLNKLDLTCTPGTPPAFKAPTIWPICIPFLNCSDPPIDTQVMKYDWTASKGNSPNMTVS